MWGSSVFRVYAGRSSPTRALWTRRGGGCAGLHKLTTRLAGHYGTIVVEDLQVAGMVGNRRPARAIGDAGFGELRRQLAYKAGWHGGRLSWPAAGIRPSKTLLGVWRRENQAHPHRTDLRLPSLRADQAQRNLNAARNLAALVAGSGPQTIDGRGADGKTPPAGAWRRTMNPAPPTWARPTPPRKRRLPDDRCNSCTLVR